VAATFNERSVAAETIAAGVQRQRLLDRGRIAHTRIFLDRLSLSPRASTALDVANADIAWVQVLHGSATLKSGDADAALDEKHIAFIPPGFTGTLSTPSGAAILCASVPDAARFDLALANAAPPLRVVDWTCEPVLASEHDARKRIYVATPALFGTKAIKGEMIIYPPGTQAPSHHHEGAEHFMYVLRGRGTVYANERPFAVRQGDTIYYPDRERHYLQAAKDEELVFAEYFAPAEFRTVWVDESQICTWHPTGRDIAGRPPVREIKAHSSAEVANPADV
jgi:quercetin dioxygenase-like cupin family protein